MKPIVYACFAAIAVQPVVFIIVFLLPLALLGADIPRNDLLGTPFFAALVAAPFVVIVGIPTLLVLRRFDRLSWRSIGAVGFIAAALPIALNGWSDYPGFSSGGNWYGTSVNFVINGRKTLFGWLQYAQGILEFGIHGLSGALAFYFVNRLARSQAASSVSQGVDR